MNCVLIHYIFRKVVVPDTHIRATLVIIVTLALSFDPEQRQTLPVSYRLCLFLTRKGMSQHLLLKIQENEKETIIYSHQRATRKSYDTA